MERRRVEIKGMVQGVGFRPFVYRVARQLQLTGYVLNTSEGVLIEVQGGEPALEVFVRRLRSEAPPFAAIESLAAAEVAVADETAFVIRESVGDADKFGLVLPDIATCDECVNDFTDPDNRRFGYPFTNCTNCGPRYTIIRDLPYDRPMTTMAAFTMCDDCRAEYENPGDRRFHAQPNACAKCGPSLSTELGDVRRLLREGRIVAIKGLGGFHLACDATNAEAVRQLRERKRRSDKPFALMARDLAAVNTICSVSEVDRKALLSAQRPIVIMPRAQADSLCHVAPGNKTLGVMLPYTPLHHLLFSDDLPLLVMTSGNLSEEPIVISNRQARERLAIQRERSGLAGTGVADAFLFHDRDIYMRVDDSVVRTFEGTARVLRRSRSFAPVPLDLGGAVREILACGAELKNTFCLTKERYALLSQHIGDLENYETLEFFQETLANMKKLFKVTPRLAAYDLHPLYLSTRFALELEGVEKIGVQHHHAHIASCMAENRLGGKVIGVAFDGTGYGTDGKIWGGEFLIADYGGFERRAHLRYVPLPGGDTAIRQPWRSALAHLIDAGCKLQGRPGRDTEIVTKMIRQRINCVDTSSCGRLFDAVASITGVRHETNFEGQAAIELEMFAEPGVEDTYAFEIGADQPWQIDMRPAIAAIASGVTRGETPGSISAKFHNTVAAMVVEVCRRLRNEEKLNRVCLSGGTFQNVYLLTRTVAGLRSCGFEVFLHAKVPPNDGGISLGQAVIANYTAERSAP